MADTPEVRHTLGEVASTPACQHHQDRPPDEGDYAALAGLFSALDAVEAAPTVSTASWRSTPRRPPM